MLSQHCISPFCADSRKVSIVLLHRYRDSAMQTELFQYGIIFGGELVAALQMKPSKLLFVKHYGPFARMYFFMLSNTLTLWCFWLHIHKYIIIDCSKYGGQRSFKYYLLKCLLLYVPTHVCSFTCYVLMFWCTLPLYLSSLFRPLCILLCSLTIYLLCEWITSSQIKPNSYQKSAN